jgi:hypothetical protein
MPDKVTLIRHDGSLMDATPEQAGRLKILGYQEVAPEQNYERLRSESAADYYQSSGQQLQTLSEGVANGLDFGLTDYLFGDEDTKARAQYNPGMRIGSETLGAILPMFLTGGESAAATGARLAEEGGVLKGLASVAPTSLLSDAAHALAPERTFTGALTRGMIEGGVYGGAGAADHAYLDGEPITAETVLHGIGWGAIIGGGLGLVGHAVEVGGEAAAKAKAAEEAAARPVPQGALRSMAGSEYGALRDEAVNLGANIKEAVGIADINAQEVLGALKKAGEADKTVNLTRFNQIEFRENVQQAEKLWEKAKDAANKGSFAKANEAIEEYAAHSRDLAKKLNIDVADPAKPLQDLVVMRNVAKVTANMPKTVEAFASMGAQKMEATVAALEKAKGLPFKTGLDEATANFKTALGLDQAGDLRVAHKTSRSILQSEGKTPKAPPKSNQPGMLRKAVGYAAGGKAWLAAKATGFGRVGAYTAYRSVRDAVTYGGEHFAGVKAAALSGIREAAAAWGPSVGRGAQKVAGAGANPLAFTIFGEPDKGARDAKELAARRVAEIAHFAPTAKDAIYKAVQPIAITQPMLAPSIHKSALAAFQALQTMAPRDPGSISALMSTWKPSDLQAQTFAKQLAVFRDPVGEAINALKGDRPDLVKIDALKKMAPAIYQDWRLAMIQRISQPEVLSSLKPNDQLFLSVALDFPVHSRMAPGQIATGQQIFVDRSQPLKANPRIGPGGGLPNPSDNNNRGDTQAARSTER